MIIYCATNMNTGKTYVGLTTCTLRKRMGEHRRKALNERQSSAFYRSIRKHGWNAFEWRVLEEASSLEALCAAERKWIAALDSFCDGNGYNVRDGGNVRVGHTFEVKPATREKIRASLLGQRHSQDRREKNRLGAARRLASGNFFLPKVNNTSGLAGVSLDKRSGKWAAYINPSRKKVSLGSHVDFFEAACARKSAEAALLAGRL